MSQALPLLSLDRDNAHILDLLPYPYTHWHLFLHHTTSSSRLSNTCEVVNCEPRILRHVHDWGTSLHV